MSNIKKISSYSEWNTTTRNRISLDNQGLAKLFYFDHSFSGLSVDSIYWRIVDQTGNCLSFDNAMTVSIDSLKSLSELRSRNYYSGDFDIYVTYYDLLVGGYSQDKYVYFGLNNEDINSSSNINIRLGIGTESGALSFKSQIWEDNQTILTYSNTEIKNYEYGKVRIKREGAKIDFYVENLSGTWESIGTYTNVVISSNEDLYLYFSSEFGNEMESSSSEDSSSSSDGSSTSSNSSDSSIGNSLSGESSLNDDLFSITFGDIISIPVLLQYSGNIYFNFDYDEAVDQFYYSLSASLNSTKHLVSIRAKSSSTESGLDLEPWSAFQTTLDGNFSVASSDRYVRINVKLLSYEYKSSPLIDTVIVGLESELSPDEVPIVIAPSSNEAFDNILRIIWEIPTVATFSNSSQKYYKIEYKNENLGIINWVLLDNRIDPQIGYYDWDVSNLDEDVNYQIRITSVYAGVSDLSSSLPTQLEVEESGDEDYNGIYRLIGIHNGENLYEGDNGYLYYSGDSFWILNSSIDNYSYDYYNSTVLGQWLIANGTSPGPIVSEYISSTSESSENIFESSSSSYDFSSTSSLSSESSSTQILSSSSNSSSSESSESSSTEVLSTSSESSSASSESSSSSQSSESSSTEQVAFSSTSSESSSSTKILSTSSSSSIFALLKGTGLNSFGQLGLNDNDNRSVFVEIPISEINDFIIIASGAYHSVLQKSDGTVWVSGRNDYGQLGLGDNIDRNSFIQLPASFNDAVKIVCGEYFTVIEKIDGTVWVSGRNNKGQLGLGDNVNRNSFEELDLKYASPRNIAAGSEFLMIVKANGYLDSVGANESGQLGLDDNADRNEFEATDIRVGNLISVGSQFAYIVDYEGFIKSVGNNYHGQLGLGDNINRKRFTEVPGFLNPKNIMSGGSHVFIEDASGNLKSCGDNTLGQLGLGDNNDRNSFENMGISNPLYMSLGFHHSMVVSSNGVVYGCGYNIYGQLGLGHENNVNILTRSTYYTYPENVVCGGYHTFILTEYAESESSEDVESSSSSMDEDLNSYPYGYMQFSNINMADPSGEFIGDSFYIPADNVNLGILTYVSISYIGIWELQKYDTGSGNFITHGILKPGNEESFSDLLQGDLVRMKYIGPASSEVYSYKISMRKLIGS